MEELLVEDVADKCLTDEPAAATAATSASSSKNSESNAGKPQQQQQQHQHQQSPPPTTTTTSRVMSMLYIQPGKLHANQPSNNSSSSSSSSNSASSSSSNGVVLAQPAATATATIVQPQPQQPLVNVVNKSQIAAFDQIVLQGLAPSNQGQIPTQLITIRRQINTVNATSASQTQKNILVRKSNASSAQIMPLGTPQESPVVQNQTSSKSRFAYVGTIIKPKPQESVVLPTGSINTTQAIKQKLVFAPVISHVPQTTNTTSNNLQSQSSKHMTNLILPVSISQQSASVSKQNLSFKSNFNFKLNNGQNNNDAKSTITVLRESKTSNSTVIPPALHPIANMSLLNISKTSSNSTDSIKINENPDSAVITPIPKTEDSNNIPEKRKKTISNILRSSGEKRVRKQSFSKSSQETNVVDVSNYSLNSPESEHDKEKRKDKESDDDITFIKVVPSEEKKIKRPSLSDEVKIEVVKSLNRKGVEVIEKINGQSNDEEIKDEAQGHQNDSNFDATKVLDWKDGVGSLPGSTLKFCMNEFGLMEVVDEDENKQDKNKNIGDKENVCFTQNSSKSSTPTAISEKKTEEKKSQNLGVDDKAFCCCQGCGCYGPLSEFYTSISCSLACAQYIEDRKQQKLRKEKESNKETRPKKKRKKILQEQEVKDEDKPKESSSKMEDVDEKSKDSEEKFDNKLQDRIKSSDEDTKDTNISLIDEESQGESESKQYPWQTGKLGFSWSKYLEYTKTKPAPTKLFKDAFPDSKNNFKVGMKLEGIDPNHPSHYCVLTVAEVVGYRLRLHFDGYAENFDFWVNADSMDIFPVGWAEKNGHQLQPPKGYVQSNFNWNAYLKICKAIAAPKTLFSNKNSMLPTGFRVGMKLEAVDRKHSSLVCVASVADVMDSRILVHFDSWDDIYDYWADVSSPYIHPIGWCHHNGRSLTPPNYYKDPKAFSWDEYLKTTSAIAAPARAFKQRPPCGFKRGMKLEAVDKRLPQLIRVATVEDVKDHMLKIRFDGWPENHAYWVDDDSTDIHPYGWCAKTGHPLEPPLTQDNLNDRPECGTYGCKGIGHVKGPKFATHNSASGCPYSPQNLNKIKTITDRLNLKHEINDFDEDFVLERAKSDKFEKRMIERSEKRLLSIEEKPIKVENIKQEDGDLSDKNEDKRLETTERLSNKWRNNSDGQTDDDEIFNKRKKRKLKDDSNLSVLNSSYELSSSRIPYAANIPDKQLRTELYQSVYDPGYKPLPDAPHIWAKHSSALNRIVAQQNTNPRRWSNEEVIKFIQSVPNCQEIGRIFRKNNIDGEAFLMLTQEDLVSLLGLRLGPALKLYNSIVLLRKRAT